MVKVIILNSQRLSYCCSVSAIGAALEKCKLGIQIYDAKNFLSV